MKGRNTELNELKAQVAGWLFSMLTVFSKSEFLQLLHKMEEEKKLDIFRMRVENARALYKQICALCTDKQVTIAAQAFYYGITYDEQPYQDIDGTVGHQRLVVYRPTAVDEGKKRCVNAKICSATDYNTYKNVLADVLINTVDENNDIILDKEEKAAEATYHMFESYFDEQKKIQNDIKMKKEKMLAELAAKGELPDEDQLDCLDILSRNKRKERDPRKEAIKEAAKAAVADFVEKEVPQMTRKEAERRAEKLDGTMTRELRNKKL